MKIQDSRFILHAQYFLGLVNAWVARALLVSSFIPDEGGYLVRFDEYIDRFNELFINSIHDHLSSHGVYYILYSSYMYIWMFRAQQDERNSGVQKRFSPNVGNTDHECVSTIFCDGLF